MNTLHLDPTTTALVLIDLQNGILALPLAPHSAEQLLGHARALATAMRAKHGTVVRVRVDLSELRYPPVDRPTMDPAAPPPPPIASEFPAAFPAESSDLVITKRQWGAFYATELDQQLRRRDIRTIVLAGITTNFGVESTARAAFDRGYQIVFVEDAMTSVDAQAHNFAMQGVFPFMGSVRSTTEVLHALDA